MSLGQRVKMARERARLSQDELAKLAGVPRTTISGIEALNKQPRTTTLAALARALNVNLNELMDQHAIVVSIQENERNLMAVVTEVASVLESARDLSVGIRQEAALRSTEGQALSQAVTSLAAAATTSSESTRMVADELIGLRRALAALEHRVLELERTRQAHEPSAAQTSASEVVEVEV